ncbi:hypothetical protein HY995_03740, partial [Candidatus Micrarchaeota archaeon]|nr:hypothetical protein [Candidatus Micrarchaeota archaeon]
LSASEITALYNAGNPTNATGQEGNWSAFTSEYYGGNASVSNVVGKLVQYRASLNSSGGSNYSAFLQNVTLNLGTEVVGMNLLNSSCSLQGASGNNVTANCSFALPYYFTAGLAWCAVNATDASGAFANATSNAAVNSLLALSASPSSINYGSIDPGSNSSAQAVNVTNFGNVALDAKFESTNLTSSGLADINASNQWYSFSTLGTGSDYRQVPNSTSAFNTTYNLGPSASGATSNATQYFIIAMDSGVRAGAYSGVLTITAAAH